MGTFCENKHEWEKKWTLLFKWDSLNLDWMGG